MNPVYYNYIFNLKLFILIILYFVLLFSMLHATIRKYYSFFPFVLSVVFPMGATLALPAFVSLFPKGGSAGLGAGLMILALYTLATLVSTLLIPCGFWLAASRRLVQEKNR